MKTTHVKVVVAGQSLVISPWIPALSAWVTVTRKDDDGYVTTEPLYEIATQGDVTVAVFPSAGLVDKVVEWLERNPDYTYELERNEVLPPEPLYDEVEDLREDHPNILAAMVDNPRGILEAPTGDGKTFIMCQAARMWCPLGLKILFIVPGIALARSVKRRLEKAMPDRTICRCDSKRGGTFIPAAAACVASPFSLHHVPVDWPDIVIADEVHEMGSPTVYPGLMAFQECNFYGFSATPFDRSDNGNLAIEATFGSYIYRKEYQRSVRQGYVAQIHVEIYTVETEEVPAKSKASEQRTGYWLNHVRNQAIAELASQFKDDQQLLIYCNRVEHVLALRRLLPDYALIYGPLDKRRWAELRKMRLVEQNEWEEMKSPDVDALTQAFEANTIKRAICTGCWRKGVDFPHLYGLIRADGSSGKIDCVQVAGRLSRTGSGDTAVLIDFLDRFGKSFLNRSYNRIKHYRDQGWKISLDGRQKW
jgi:superfamily II DNA or RNA helicase